MRRYKVTLVMDIEVNKREYDAIQSETVYGESSLQALTDRDLKPAKDMLGVFTINKATKEGGDGWVHE